MSTSRRSRVAEWEECPCAGRNLERFLQPAILAVLAEGPVHGYRIVQALGQMPALGRRQPDAAGVYRFLKAMEDRGLVTSEWDLSEAGPAKRLFDLSSEGKACLSRWAATLEEYRFHIGQLIQSLRRAMGSASGGPCACARSGGRKAGPAPRKRHRSRH